MALITALILALDIISLLLLVAAGTVALYDRFVVPRTTLDKSH